MKASFLGAIIAVALADAAAVAGAAPFDAAAETYRHQLTEDMGQALTGALTLRERLIAKDLIGARRAWIDARVGWERSEVFTSGFVPALDQAIDAWPNASHGFHGIEATLFGASGAAADADPEIDMLIANLSDVQGQVAKIDLAPQRLLNGIAWLAFEVGGNKADGGESRLSGTSLFDMQNNADSIASAWQVIFAEALAADDPKLAARVSAVIARLQAARLQAGVGITDLRQLDAEELRADSEELVALLAMAAPKLGLSKPTLEEGAR
ncbi:MAG TPA: EfeM/EfeO family lipoprotein [Xanthobacteraceae bacterium]